MRFSNEPLQGEDGDAGTRRAGRPWSRRGARTVEAVRENPAGPVPLTKATLLTGISEERRLMERPLDGVLAAVTELPSGQLVEVEVDPARLALSDGTPAELTDALTGGSIQDNGELWGGRIEMVDVARGRMVVEWKGSSLPAPGDPFRAFPFPFLRKLEEWAETLEALPERFEAAKGAGKAVAGFGDEVFAALPEPAGLRPSQRDAIRSCRRQLALI